MMLSTAGAHSVWTVNSCLCCWMARDNQIITMASVPSSYSPRNSAYWPSSAVRSSPIVDPNTPPPPPPKPNSHEASRRGTPLAGARPGVAHSPDYQGDYQGQALPGSQSENTTFYGSDEQPQIAPPEPPRIEDEWLPDIVRDKSCVGLPSGFSLCHTDRRFLERLIYNPSYRIPR